MSPLLDPTAHANPPTRVFAILARSAESICSGVLALVTLAAVGRASPQQELYSGPADASGTSADVERLFGMLAARDQAWLPVRLEYSLWSVEGRSSDASAVRASGSSARCEQRGNLWWDGRTVLTQFDAYADGEALAALTILARPGECKTLLRDLREARSTAYPAVRTIDKRPSVYLDASGPLQYGFGHVFQTWPHIRSVSDRVHVRGRETVLSRDCVRVGLSYGGATASEKTVPIDVWIDDRETMLVLRIETYAPVELVDEQDGYSDGDLRDLAVTRDGARVLPTFRWDVLEVGQHAGHWIATAGRVRHCGSLLPDDCRIAIVEPTSFEVGVDMPAASFDLPPGGAHFDYVRDETYTVARQDSPMSSRQTDYWETLEAFGLTSIRSNAQLDFAAIEFERSTCGANAALLMSHLNGRWCSLEQLHAAAELEPRPGGENDLLEIQRMLEAQHLHVRAVEMDFTALEEWGDYVVAHTRAAMPDPEPDSEALRKHFLVAKAERSQSERGVQFVSPPGKVMHADEQSFGTIWTGRALLVSSDPARIDDFLRARSGWGGLRIAGLAAGAAALALVVLLLRGRAATRKELAHA